VAEALDLSDLVLLDCIDTENIAPAKIHVMARMDEFGILSSRFTDSNMQSAAEARDV
jgi:hypothetical protein